MPTLKQKKAFEKVLENTAKPISQAMLEAGYTPDTAKNPHQLTESKGFKELLEQNGLDDLSLARRHKELLDNEPNIAIKALDMAYKVKAHYAPDRSLNFNVGLTINDEAIDALASLLDSKAKSAMNAVHERTNQPGDGAAADALDPEIPD